MKYAKFGPEEQCLLLSASEMCLVYCALMKVAENEEFAKDCDVFLKELEDASGMTDSYRRQEAIATGEVTPLSGWPVFRRDAP